MKVLLFAICLVLLLRGVDVLVRKDMSQLPRKEYKGVLTVCIFLSIWLLSFLIPLCFGLANWPWTLIQRILGILALLIALWGAIEEKEQSKVYIITILLFIGGLLGNWLPW